MEVYINFNGVTMAINKSSGVDSIIDNGTGDYTINFTESFSDGDYLGFMNTNNSSNTTRGGIYLGVKNADPATYKLAGSCRITCLSAASAGSSAFLTDNDNLTVVFRDDA